MTQLELFPAATPPRATSATIPATDSRPAWVQQYDTPGAPKSIHGGKAIPQQCPKCNQWILVGYDAPFAANRIQLDPTITTNPQIEAAAILLKRHTYRIKGTLPFLEIIERHHPDLLSHPMAPASDTCHVAFQHACGKPPLATQPLPIPTRYVYPDEPPY